VSSAKDETPAEKPALPKAPRPKAASKTAAPKKPEPARERSPVVEDLKSDWNGPLPAFLSVSAD
jgi:hypothetical protein